MSDEVLEKESRFEEKTTLLFLLRKLPVPPGLHLTSCFRKQIILNYFGIR